MATFGSMAYFLKVGQEPTKCENDCDDMTNSAPDCVLINDPKNCSEKSYMLPFLNDLKHFPVCLTFHLATIVQNVGYN